MEETSNSCALRPATVYVYADIDTFGVPWPSLLRQLYLISPDTVNLCLSCDFKGIDFVRGRECGSSS